MALLEAGSRDGLFEARAASVAFAELQRARRAAGLVVTTATLVVEGHVDRDASAAAIARRAERTARRLLTIHGVTVTAAGETPRAPAVLVTNHVSYLDPLVVAAVAPCIAIAKGEAERWPLIGAGLRALGVVFVQRGDAHSGAVALRRARRALEGGAIVLNFPEGTTGTGGAVAPFRRGIFGLARMAGVPVVPAHVSYDDDRVPWIGGQAFAPHYWRLSRTARIGARVRFGEPWTVGACDDPGAVAARARAAVIALASPDDARDGRVGRDSR
jgi:lyso-ornithine lipid O-acyltransferase